MLSSMDSGEMALPAAATVESTTIMIMPEISSRTRMPKAMGQKPGFKRFSSSERFAYNSGGAHGKHAAGKDAVGKAPASSCAQAKPRQAMPVNSVTAANNGRIGCAFYFIKIVIKAKVEQYENNAYIRPYGNIVAVDNVLAAAKSAGWPENLPAYSPK